MTEDILTFTAIDTVSIVAGDSEESDPINIYGANSVMLTMQKTGNSASVVYTVLTSADGTNFDTEAYQTFNIAAAGTKQISRPVTVGARYIKIVAKNDGSDVCTVTVKYVPVYGR